MGALTVGALSLVLLGFVSLVLEPYLRVVTGVEGDAFVTVTEERVHGLLADAAVVSCVLIAFLPVAW